MTLNVFFLLRHHTLVLTDSKRIYSFGRGEVGQLGHGEESHPSVPLPVQLPRGNYNSIISEFKYVSARNDFIKKKTLCFRHFSRPGWWSKNYKHLRRRKLFVCSMHVWWGTNTNTYNTSHDGWRYSCVNINSTCFFYRKFMMSQTSWTM